MRLPRRRLPFAAATLAILAYLLFCHNGRGLFWVALPSPRSPDLEPLARWPWLRRVVQRLPTPLREQNLGRTAWVLGFDTEGKVVHNLQDPAGHYGPVTSVIEAKGRLYLGSIGTSAIGWIAAP